MADLRVDVNSLRAQERTLAEMRTLLTEPMNELKSIPTGMVGQEVLRDRLTELGGSWGIGLQKLSDFAEGASQMLAGVADAFQQMDTELGNAAGELVADPAPARTTGGNTAR